MASHRISGDAITPNTPHRATLAEREELREPDGLDLIGEGT
ncbi:hypothetical protein [Haloferula sp.]